MATLRLQLSGKVFVVCGLWLVVLGLYFLLLRPALLPEDPRFMGSSIETLRAAAPGLERWLGNVFNVMGGFMVATGAITLLVACRYLASRKRGTFPVMAVATDAEGAPGFSAGAGRRAMSLAAQRCARVSTNSDSGSHSKDSWSRSKASMRAASAGQSNCATSNSLPRLSSVVCLTTLPLRTPSTRRCVS